MSAALQAVMQGLKYIPATLGVKALEKVSPNFKNFFTQAAAYGVDTNRAIDYLVNRFTGEQEGPFQGHMRDDQKVAQNQVDASRIPGKVLTGAASLAGAGIGSGLFGGDEAVQEQPQQQSALQGVPEAVEKAKINEDTYRKMGATPQNLARETYEKTKPRSSQSSTSQSPGAQGLIAQHPELGAYIDQQIKSGIPPAQAAQAAKSQRKFSPTIQKIEERVGQDFVDVVNQLYQGTEQFTGSRQPPQQRAANSELAGLLQQYISLKRGK